MINMGILGFLKQVKQRGAIYDALNLMDEADGYGAFGRGPYKDSKHAAELCVEAAQIGERIRHDKTIRLAYSSAGRHYENAGVFNAAIECYTKSAAAARRMGDEESENSVCFGIAMCYAGLNEYEKAVEAMRRYGRFALEKGDIDHYKFSAGQIGGFLELCGDYTGAIATYIEATKFHDSDDNFPKSDTLFSLAGNCNVRLRDMESAAQNFMDAAENAIRCENESSAGSYYLYAGICQHEGKIGDFAGTLQKAITCCEADREFVHGSNSTMGRCYEFLGDYGTAKSHFETADLLLQTEVKKAKDKLAAAEDWQKDMEKRTLSMYEGWLNENRLFLMRNDSRILFAEGKRGEAASKLEKVLVGFEQLLLKDPRPYINELELEKTKSLLEQTKKESEPRKKVSAFEYFPRKKR